MSRPVALVLLAVLPYILAAPDEARAAPRPAVVELFTSEGCSSCPPADALLAELALEPQVLALAFHVGYWDRLGWPDRFALALADARQTRYVQTLALPSAFTPQVVIDGQLSFIGSDRRRIEPELRAARAGIGIALAWQADELTIDLAPAAIATVDVARNADVLLLALRSEAQTKIARGENGGRTLREVDIVRAAVAIGTCSGAAQRYSYRGSTLPADADAVAVLVQQAGQRSILGAARIARP